METGIKDVKTVSVRDSLVSQTLLRDLHLETGRTTAMAAYSLKFYRSDIQGLRAFSALTIMVYHIWLNRVSGGVDVFFLVSGFLIATNLLREADTTGKIRVSAFWARMAARILPSALFVLVCTASLTLLLVPPPLWKFAINELIASTLQVQNWELFRSSTNYLNRDDPPSQFQQFWALSIQIQFYIMVPLLFLFLLPLVRRFQSFLPVAIFFGVCAALSLAWSAYFTAVSPAQSYFSTLTRLWEFFFGVLLALAYPYIAARDGTGVFPRVLYVGSLATLAIFGLAVPTSVQFPGLISLVPVLCAATFIASGAGVSPSSKLSAVLNSAQVARLGELSFTIYLWHWPLLIFAQHQLQTTKLSIPAGLGVVFLAFILSWLTHAYIEAPGLKRLRAGDPLRTLAICGGTLFIFAGMGLGLRQGMIREAREMGSASVPLLGAQSISSDMVSAQPTLKQFVLSNYDRPPAINRCLSGRFCEFGDVDAKFTVALVGASHAAQWQPVLDYAGRKNGFRVVTVLSTPPNLELIDKLAPDVVVTTATTTQVVAIGEQEGVSQETVTVRQTDLWEALEKRRVPIIAIRDNPRFLQYQNGCIWQDTANQDECSLQRHLVFQSENPAKAYTERFSGLHLVDLSDLFCLEASCPAVVNGQIVYYDRHHFSDSFMRHIAAAATDEIFRQAPDILPVKPKK